MYKKRVVVIGGGPAGYAAAFALSNKDMEVFLIDKNPQLGGVCLHYGCIPSKQLLHFVGLHQDLHQAYCDGVIKQVPKFDLEILKVKKNKVVQKLAMGLMRLARKKNVQVINAWATFKDENHLTLSTDDKQSSIYFDYAIIATGSEPIQTGEKHPLWILPTPYV